MTPQQILIAAAGEIEKHGHCQGLYENEDGCLCMSGAIYKVVTGNPEASFYRNEHPNGHAAIFLLKDVLWEKEQCKNIPSFNDRPDVDKSKAIAMLLLAAGSEKSVAP